MERIWLKQYPPEVPADIDADVHPSLTAMIERQVSRYRDRPAFSNAGTALSYGNFAELAGALAAYFQVRMGLRKGDRIALMLPNLLQYPVAMHAALRAGLIVVNVNPLYSPRELKHQLDDAQAQAIVILADVTPALGEIIADTGLRHILVTQSGDLAGGNTPTATVDARLGPVISFTDALQEGRRLPFMAPALAGGDLAFLQYTGGTTGLSKGTMLTHRNLVANTLQTHAVYASRFRNGREIFITALPLYHIFALTGNCLLCLYVGGVNVLITHPRDMAGFVEELRKWRFTFITGVNTLYNGLLHTPGFETLDFSALHTSIAGGMPLQRAVADKWRRVTGCVANEGYGLSETSPVLCTNFAAVTEFNGTVGQPVPSTELSIRDGEGNEVPQGQAGELCARGPQLMAGYWNQPEETRKAMTADGFFRTGDIAEMDERGFVKIVDRKKDMILVSGFNVYPNEVEGVIASMEQVLECACIGVPDERSGEAVRLFVVAKPGAPLNNDAILAWCRARLAPYKIPRHIDFLDALPKSNVGKILRRELRAKMRTDSFSGTEKHHGGAGSLHAKS